MENILTVAGSIQLLLSLFSADRMAAAPGLIFGILVFAILVSAVRQILKEMAVPAKKRGAPVRKLARIV